MSSCGAATFLNTCVFSLCLENIRRRMVNLLAEDTFKSFSLTIDVRSVNSPFSQGGGGYLRGVGGGCGWCV